MTQVESLADGYAYHDGTKQALVNTADKDALRESLLNECVDWAFGPVSIHACFDIAAVAVSASATLFGVKLADCELNTGHQSCDIGGSLGDFKADLTLTLSENPFQLKIDGQACAPVVGCKQIDRTIQL